MNGVLCAAPALHVGAGDLVALVTQAVGVKPCQSCKERQESLNRLVPFKGRAGGQ